jgi:hypothetical protein
MSVSTMQHIDRFTNENQISFRLNRYVFRIALIGILVAGFSVDNLAQIKPSMKIKLDVLPSINVARMDVDLQALFAENIAHLNELASIGKSGEDPISLDFGFSISAYENITVLLSYTKPEISEKENNRYYPMRILCGYLNDGTTSFKRAITTEKNFLEFRLRNNHLLKRSMKFSEPLFVAYAFFLVSHHAGAVKEEGPLPVSTITLEFL